MWVGTGTPEGGCDAHAVRGWVGGGKVHRQRPSQADFALGLRDLFDLFGRKQHRIGDVDAVAVPSRPRSRPTVRGSAGCSARSAGWVVDVDCASVAFSRLAVANGELVIEALKCGVPEISDTETGVPLLLNDLLEVGDRVPFLPVADDHGISLAAHVNVFVGRPSGR